MNRSDREKLDESRHEAYVDIDDLGSDLPVLRPHRSTRSWLGYERVFVHRCRRLDPAATSDELAAVCRDQSLRTLAYVDR